MKRSALTQRKPGKSSKKTEKGTQASSPSLQKATDCLGTSVEHNIGEGNDADRAAAKSCLGATPVTDVKYCLQEVWKLFLLNKCIFHSILSYFLQEMEIGTTLSTSPPRIS